jgi:hypothetical protein
MVILRVFCVAIVLSGAAACAMEIENKVLVPQKRWCDLFTIKEHYQLEGIIEKHMSGYEGIVVDIRALAKESNTWKEILDTEYHTEHLLRAIDRRSMQINSKNNFDMSLRCEAQFLHLELAAVVLGTRGAIAFGKKYIQMPEAKQRVVNFLFQLVSCGHRGNSSSGYLAWEDEDLDVVRAALDMGIDPCINDNNYGSLLITAANVNKPKVVELLLDNCLVAIETRQLSKGFSMVEYSEKFGTNMLTFGHDFIKDVTALLSASEHGSDDVVDFLISRKANVNATDNFLRTPLMLAAISGYRKIVEKLLAAGAVVWLLDKDEKTALDHATIRLSSKKKEDYEAIVKLLKDAGAK